MIGCFQLLVEPQAAPLFGTIVPFCLHAQCGCCAAQQICTFRDSTATLLHNRVLVHALVTCTGTLQQSTF